MHAEGDRDFSPFVWHFRAFAFPGMLGSRFFLPGAELSQEKLDGKTVVVLKSRRRVPPGMALEYTVWLDPESDYSVCRFSKAWDGRLQDDHRLKYVRNDDGHYVPVEWQFEEFYRGRLIESKSVKVVDAVINRPVEETVFKLEFPLGTTVVDQREQRERYMLIGTKGREYQVTLKQTDGAASPEELLATLDSDDHSAFGWSVIVFVIAVLAVGLFYWWPGRFQLATLYAI
jgi:hypothetical protein